MNPPHNRRCRHQARPSSKSRPWDRAHTGCRRIGRVTLNLPSVNTSRSGLRVPPSCSHAGFHGFALIAEVRGSGARKTRQPKIGLILADLVGLAARKSRNAQGVVETEALIDSGLTQISASRHSRRPRKSVASMVSAPVSGVRLFGTRIRRMEVGGRLFRVRELPMHREGLYRRVRGGSVPARGVRGAGARRRAGEDGGEPQRGGGGGCSSEAHRARYNIVYPPIPQGGRESKRFAQRAAAP